MADKLWCPTRGYFEIGAGGAAETPADAPEADAAAPVEETAAAAPVAAAAPAAGGAQVWAPTRGYFSVGGTAAPAAAPAAAAAPKKAAPPQAAAAKSADKKPAAAPKAAAKKPAAKKAAPAPVKKAPAADPQRDSVTVVPGLTDAPWAKSVGKTFFTEPDSETTLYRMPAMNALFAVCSIIMLVYFVLVLWQDYWRPWKQIQSHWNTVLVRTYEEDLEAARKSQTELATELEPEVRQIVTALLADESAAAINAVISRHGNTVEGAAPRVGELVEVARDGLENDEEYQRLKAQLNEQTRLLTFADGELRDFRGMYQAEKFVYEEKKAHALEALGDTTGGQHEIEELDKEFREKFDLRLEELSATVETLTIEHSRADEALNAYTRDRTAVNGGVSIVDLEGRLEEISRSIQEVEARIAVADTGWRNAVRNAPIFDALAPSYVIKKQVVNDVHEDLNFLTVPRIDRCQTCHINIDDPSPGVAGFVDEEYGSVYASHPRLDLFVGSSSPHPVETFGCTGCHYGDGHSTSFVTASHTPNSAAQEEEWTKKYHWHEMHHQDWPMVLNKYVTSSCRKCHANEENLEGGGSYNRGYEIVKEYGCYGCHRIEQFDDAEKVGPTLRYLADKVDLDFLYKWVRDPTHFRPSTRMPRFFDLTNTRGQMLIAGADGQFHPTDFDSRNGVEALALATYLHKSSERRDDIAEVTLEGDPVRGREAFMTIGCLGCHSLKAESSGEAGKTDAELEALAQAAVKALAVDEENVAQQVGAATDDSTRARWESLATSLGEARERVAYLPVWLARLPVGETMAAVYHRAGASLDDVERLAAELGFTAEAVDGARLAANAFNDRWAHSTFAPDLSAIGSKVGRVDWLVDWIMDPRRHDPKTVMPRFRLDQDRDGVQKAADIAAYLMSFRDAEFDERPVFAIDSAAKEKVLSDIVYDYKRRDASRQVAREEVDAMSTDEKLMFAGMRLIRRYGCFGCHNGIQDRESQREAEVDGAKTIVMGNFDNAQSIGTELTGWGIKEVKRLDYGHWGHQSDGSYALPKHRYSWAEAKLTDTRRFDVFPAKKLTEDGTHTYMPTNRMVQKSPEELLKMPLFGFVEDPKQVDGVVTFLLSLELDPILSTKIHVLDADEQALEDGRRLIAKLNCQGCHRIGAETQHVGVDELPLFSMVADEGLEGARSNVAETEAWLARAMKFHGRAAASDVDAVDVGTTYPADTLLSQQVWDATTMDESSDESLSLTELARQSFELDQVPPGTRVLPVSGYQEGAIREYLGASATDRFRAPPPLVRQGERTRPDWLFRFLQNVTMIRPWLKVRMPSFHLSQEEARTLVRWFSIRYGVPYAGELFAADIYDEELARLGQEMFKQYQCSSCHPSAENPYPDQPLLDPGDRFDWKEFPFAVPDSTFYVVWKESGELQHQAGFKTDIEAQMWAQEKFGEGSTAYALGQPWTKSSWGPDLSLAAKRLRPTWLFDWLKDPPAFMPGTKMPNFFGSGSDDPMSGHPLDGDPDPETLRRMHGIVQYLVHMKVVDGLARN